MVEIGSYTMEFYRYIVKLLAFFLVVFNKLKVFQFEVGEFSNIKIEIISLWLSTTDYYYIIEVLL